jgi:protocatechuate 3,4-dioxygenase beta subunit
MKLTKIVLSVSILLLAISTIGLSTTDTTATDISTISIRSSPAITTSNQESLSYPLISDSEVGVNLPDEVGVNEDSDPEPTTAVIEGPYFKPGSPERKSLLEPGIPGNRLNLTGHVLTMSDNPEPGALLDFWQADGNGAYDNIGYKLRGH